MYGVMYVLKEILKMLMFAGDVWMLSQGSKMELNENEFVLVSAGRVGVMLEEVVCVCVCVC